MRFKVDENLPRAVADLLASAGHDVSTVHEQRMVGVDDPTLAKTCRSERRVLITLDLDFSDLVAYPPAEYAGFIVVRASVQETGHVTAIVRRILPLLQSENPEARLWVVDETAVRIRDGQ